MLSVYYLRIIGFDKEKKLPSAITKKTKEEM